MEDDMPLAVEIGELVERLGSPPDQRPESDAPREFVITRNGSEWDEIRIQFMNAQDQRCAICRKEFTDLPHVDHCHATGMVRGALCNSCNIKLGWYEKRRREIESYLARAAESVAYRAAPRIPRYSTRAAQETKQRKERQLPPKEPRLPNGRTQGQDNALRERWSRKLD